MAAAAAALPGRPPYQLFRGDRSNIFPGVALMFVLAMAKDLKMFPSLVQWQLNAYTNWNLLLITLGQALSQSQWDPFLCVNSLGILMGFRTGFSQGLTENLRKKIKTHGLELSRWQFIVSDHMVHSFPFLYFMWRLVSTNRQIPHINTMYGMLLSTWFAFRQQAKLDSSAIYVPHPWRRTWIGISSGMIGAPMLVNAVVARKRLRALVIALLLFLPWCSTRFDPRLRQKYMFEYAVACVGTPEEAAQRPSPGRTCRRVSVRESVGAPGMPRVQSELY